MKVLDLFPTRSGKHCIVIYHVLAGRGVLKIFNAYPLEDWKGLEDFRWGDPPGHDQPNMSVPLIEATKIQNICWMHNLAPRVFEIVGVRMGSQRYFAQVCEDAGTVKAKTQKEAKAIYDKVKLLGMAFGFENDKDDVSREDVIEGKLVDFNTFHFTDDRLEKVKSAYIKEARYGKVYYHNVPGWGLKGGPRDNEKRVGWLGLNKMDFKGMSVADLGCAGGFFCRYVREKGAAIVHGYDYPDVEESDPVFAARLVSNELGFWKIDYFEMDLKKEKPKRRYDIVLFLSMNLHIGIPEWLPEITRHMVIFEDNSRQRDAEKALKGLFREVVKVGVAKDHGDKPIYHCYK